MSYPGPMPNQMRSAPPPRNKALVPCLAACGCVILFIIIIVAVAFKGVRVGAESIKSASASAERFLTTLEKPDTQGAYALMSEQDQNEKVKEGVFDAMEVLEKRHGHPVRHGTSQGFFMNTNNGVNTIRLTYQETFEKGAMPVDITLISEDGKWKVLGFHFKP